MLSHKCKNEYYSAFEYKNRKACNLEIAGLNPAPQPKSFTNIIKCLYL